MNDPGKKLTPEEAALLRKLQIKQQNALFGPATKLVLLAAFTVFSILTLYTAIRPFVPPPLYSDCVLLLSPAVPKLKKAEIIAGYFPQRPRCQIRSGRFSVNKVLQKGTMEAQLMLSINAYERYEMNAYDLLAALVPDQDLLPLVQSDTLAETVQAVDGLSAGSVNVPQLLKLLNRYGGLASYAGENAEIIKINLHKLQRDQKLEEGTVLIPVWLDAVIALKQLKTAEDPRAEPAPVFDFDASDLSPGKIMDWIKRVGRLGH